LPAAAPTRTDAELLEANRRFYDGLWSGARLVEPHRFNTWPLVSSLIASHPRRLEVAPGLRPRLPIEGTHMVDISAPAVGALRKRGADAMIGAITALPFADAAFDLVCALDIVEHVDDDGRAMSELSRVCAPGGTLLLSTPLHPSKWIAFDEFVGHRRRYEPLQLLAMLDEHGFGVTRSAVYGMQPKSSRLLDLGMWWLRKKPRFAMWWYNRVFMPLAVRFEKKLKLVDGMMEMSAVDEVFLLCRKGSL